LGDGGRLTLRFTNNQLRGSGSTQPDLWVFEIGPDVETTSVQISRDGRTFLDVGKVAGQTRAVDIDAFGFGANDRFSYVRLTDDTNQGEQVGEFVGADIDAVGAISSAPPTTATTTPPTSAVAVPLTAAPTSAPTTTTTTTPATPVVHPATNVRSAFAKAVVRPADVSFRPSLLLVNAFLAGALVLLIVFPSQLFDSTLQSNYEEIAGWFRRSRRWRASVQTQLSRAPTLLTVVGFGALAAVIYGFLDPDFGFNRSSAALFLGMAVGLMVISSVFDVARARYLHSRSGVESRLVLYPIGLGVAVVLVAMSRVAHFTPGYVFGVFTALGFVTTPPTAKAEGRALGLASVALLVIAIGAWVASIPISHAAAHQDPSFLVLTLDSFLSLLWVAGVQAIVFGLLPVRFTYGEQVAGWSRAAWVGLYGVGMGLFVHTMLHPDGGAYGTSTSASWSSVLALFVAFGEFSLIFWGYFRYRDLLRPRTRKQSFAKARG
jgi:hypothetical protein